MILHLLPHTQIVHYNTRSQFCKNTPFWMQKTWNSVLRRPRINWNYLSSIFQKILGKGTFFNRIIRITHRKLSAENLSVTKILANIWYRSVANPILVCQFYRKFWWIFNVYFGHRQWIIQFKTLIKITHSNINSILPAALFPINSRTAPFSRFKVQFN